MFDLTDILVIVGASVLSALFGLGVASFRTSRQLAPDAGPTEPIALLFDDGVLHHATQSALTAFALMPGVHLWGDLRESLAARFPQMPDEPTSTNIQSMTLHPQLSDDSSILRLSWRDSLCWVELAENQAGHAVDTRDHLILAASAKCAPHPAWATDALGQVIWHNDAYEALRRAAGCGSEDALFDIAVDAATTRVSLTIQPDSLEFFDVETQEAGGTTMHHATCITKLMEAEEAKRSFVQILAKTFAQLPIGLAIFDRNGQLSIFNPALVDLVGLQPHMLASKPTMLSFFDALRENRRMPEPKNYDLWRKEISAIITAAADGQYDDTWTLEDGRTYTVQGRPHPDGATAFLFEDISGEISLSRNFRSEVGQYEAILNAMEDALVVFSQGGVVTFSNEAYHRLWGQNPESAFADVTLQDTIKVWQERAHADWSVFTDFVASHQPREAVQVGMSLAGGGRLRAELMRISPDTTLVRFSTRDQVGEPDLPVAEQLLPTT